MSSTQWNRTAVKLPDERMVVETISEGGIQTRLFLEQGLWFFPDARMHVYYLPMFWRAVS